MPTLVIMAAGIGSRYGGLKQMDPVGPSRELIIDYSIYDALRAGFTRIVFIIRKSFEADFRDIIGKNIEKRVDTGYVFQELAAGIPASFHIPKERQKPWGTGHAVLLCKDAVNEPFAVINADDFYGASSFAVLCEYLKKAKDRNGKYDFSMVGYVLKNTLSDYGHVARGICTPTADGYLKDVQERTKIKKFGASVKFTEDGNNWVELSPDCIVSMNIWGFTRGLFPALEKSFSSFLQERISDIKTEYYLPVAVNNLVQAGLATVKILNSDQKWFGVTYREDHPLVKEAIGALVRDGAYPQKLW